MAADLDLRCGLARCSGHEPLGARLCQPCRGYAAVAGALSSPWPGSLEFRGVDPCGRGSHLVGWDRRLPSNPASTGVEIAVGVLVAGGGHDGHVGVGTMVTTSAYPRSAWLVCADRMDHHSLGSPRRGLQTRSCCGLTARAGAIAPVSVVTCRRGAGLSACRQAAWATSFR